MSNQIWLDQYKSLLNLTKKNTVRKSFVFSEIYRGKEKNDISLARECRLSYL